MRVLCQVLVGLAAALLTASANGAAPRAVAEGWVDGRLQSMSLREKIGQMVMVDVSGTEMTSELLAHFNDGLYGNVIFFERNMASEEQVRTFTTRLQEQAIIRSGVPMLIAVDQEGGSVNRLGALLGLKSTAHSARTIGAVYAYDRGRADRSVKAATVELAQRMRLLGFNMNLAPVLDLTDEKASYIYERSYGNDPLAVSYIAARFANVMRANRIVTTGKHFPNLSQTRPDSHKELPTLTRSIDELMAHELVPFRRLVNHLGAVMVGHVVVPELDPEFPASISPRAIQLLRRRIGWQGVVISDDIKMKALSDRYPLEEIVLRSVGAGVDILCVAWGKDKQRDTVRVIEQAVQDGKILRARIDASVRRILTLKYTYGR